MKFWFVIPWLIGYGLFTKIFERIQKTISIKKTLGNEIRKITSKYLNKIKTTKLITEENISKYLYFKSEINQETRIFPKPKILRRDQNYSKNLRSLSRSSDAQKIIKKKKRLLSTQIFPFSFGATPNPNNTPNPKSTTISIERQRSC